MRRKIDAPLPEPKAEKKKPGRKSKINDGLRYYKDKQTRRHVNILRYAKCRIDEGMEREDVINALVEEYGIKEGTATRYYERGKQLIEYSMTWDLENIRNKNIQRLDTIAEETMEVEDYQNAIKAIDTLNKTVGAYVDKKEINLEGTEIQFNFGGKQE